jgi:hypothetical protein
MINPLQTAGQWGKRLYLQSLLNLSKTGRKKYINEKLNWREFWQGRTRLISLPTEFPPV